MSLFIDADYIVYKACVTAEVDLDFGEDVILVVSKFSDAMNLVKADLGRIESDISMGDDTVLFFSDSRNFRKTIYPAYKGHRNRKKPCGYRRVIRALEDEYQVVKLPEMEADDALGIYATKHPGNVVVSPDKDMRQIPGQLYNMTDPVEEITPLEGFKWHYIQSLAGDSTDGYAGVPGLGVKRAAKLLDEEGYTWSTVVKAYEKAGLTEDDALLNARLAKILQTENYDSKLGIKLWTPSTD